MSGSGFTEIYVAVHVFQTIGTVSHSSFNLSQQHPEPNKAWSSLSTDSTGFHLPIFLASSFKLPSCSKEVGLGYKIHDRNNLQVIYKMRLSQHTYLFCNCLDLADINLIVQRARWSGSASLIFAFVLYWLLNSSLSWIPTTRALLS